MDTTAANGSALEATHSEARHFFERQWNAIKYLFNIETALIYFVMALLVFALGVGIAKYPVYIGHYAKYASDATLFSAAILAYKACRESLSSVVLLLLIAVGSQMLMADGVHIPIDRLYFQGIGIVAVVGLFGCVLTKMR